MARTTAENITFMIVRGIIALAIVGVGFYCIGQGIHFFVLPRPEAQLIRIHLLGLDIDARGLGAVIFGTGLALCYVAARTAPRSIKTRTTTETRPSQEASPQNATPLSKTVNEVTVVLEALKPPFDINKHLK